MPTLPAMSIFIIVLTLSSRYPVDAMALRVHRIDIDRSSGHITAQVSVVEPDGSTGPLETVGIDHESLTSRYNCPHTATPAEVEQALQRWLADHHQGALPRKRALESRASVVTKLAGRVLEFEGASR